MKHLKDIDVTRKRVLVRVDFNVPLTADRVVTDDTRIVAALPTIQYLIERQAKVILISHLGRPKGEKKRQYSLDVVGPVLSKLLGKPVAFANDCKGETVQKSISEMNPGSVLLLENVRYYKEEEKNDVAFSKELAALADVYVNDAFGTAHRAHASTAGVASWVQEKAAGFLIEKEVHYLGEKIENPKRPFVVILGGAKVSDKITVIESLLEKADAMLIGGAMAYTFALAQGKSVGKSLVETDKVDLAHRILTKAKEKGVAFLLPVDTVVTDKFDFENKKIGDCKTVAGNIEDDWEGVDIGPETAQLYRNAIEKAGTILWNGPMGVFEIHECAKGTFAIAEAVACSQATSIVGGGDSVKAIKQSGWSDRIDFISTGGGASLEFLEGKILPGLAALAS